MKRNLIIVFILAVLSTILFGAYVMLIYLHRDLTGPVISVNQETITASIHSAKEELLKNAAAVDAVDGDVSDTLMVESIHIQEGTRCTAILAACDQSNNVSKYSVKLDLEDYTPARFGIVDRLRFPIGSRNTQILSCLRAEDCIDGDISNKIRVNGDLDAGTKEGACDYVITVTNSINDIVTLPVTVEYYVDSLETRMYYPRIYLSDYLLYVEKGSEFHPKRYLDHLELGSDYYDFSSSSGSKVVGEEADNTFKNMTGDGRIISGTIHLSAIRMDSDVDTSRPGNYHVTFSCTTKDGYFGSVQMTVIVV